jgi:hypothetical protein
MPSRPHSRRRRAWHVQPAELAGCGGGGSDEGYGRNCGKVFCGHLFNAHSERLALGQGVGEWEECCIAMEPIADARLPFCETLRVHALSPTLTGVQLLCGHRFSAVYLLWHWCRSPMVCPICRAEYVLQKNGVPQGDVQCCSVSNFPFASRRMLQGLMRAHRQEQEDEERRQVQLMNRESMVEDVMEVILGPEQMFMLMVCHADSSDSSGSGDSSGDEVIQYLPLCRTNTNHDALNSDVFQFSVQRASLRRFTAALNHAARVFEARAASSSSSSSSSLLSEPRNVLRSTIVMRVGPTEEGDDSFLMHITDVADIEMPVVAIDLATSAAEVTSSVSVVDEEGGGAVGAVLAAHSPPTVGARDDGVVAEEVPEDQVLLDADGPRLLVVEETTAVVPTAVVATVPSVFSHVPTRVTREVMRFLPPTPHGLCRFTNVEAPCVDISGHVHMEFCENTCAAGGVDSLLAVSVSMQGSALIQEVARCLTMG